MHSFGTFGVLPGVLFPDSFRRTLPGLGATQGPADPVWGGADRKSRP